MFWNERNGIVSTIESCIQFKNKTYISTIQGVYVLEDNNFNSIEKTKNTQAWKSIEYITNNGDTTLLMGTSEGIYMLVDGAVTKILNSFQTHALCKSKFYDDVIFYGYQKSIGIISSSNLKYKDEKLINNYNKIDLKDVFSFQADDICEDGEGNVWVSSDYSGIFKIRRTNKDIGNQLTFHKDSFDIKMYNDTTDDISIEESRFWLDQDRVIISTQKGLRVYDKEKDKFVPFDKFGEKYCNGSRYVRFFLRDKNNNIWLGIQKGQVVNIEVVRFQKDGNFQIDSISYRRMPDMSITSACIDEENNQILVGASEGLFRLDMNKIYDTKKKPNVFIRKVRINVDSIIFWGQKSVQTDIKRNIKSEYNNITFEFASPFFSNESKMEYSYYLEGYDDDFSKWTLKTEKEYTNLWEGEYCFKVKSRNIFMQESEITDFKFTIHPPWFRSIYAYIGYFIILGFIIYLIVKISLYRVTKAKIKLEQIVRERTSEIMQQKEEIIAQSEELELINVELEKLSIVASETNNAIAITDNKGNIEWINSGFTRMYGYELNEFIEKYGRNLIKLSTNKEIKKIFEQCLKEKKTVIYESRTKSKTGEGIWSQTTITPILDFNGNISQLIAIDSDIRKLKKVEQELLQKNEEILAQNEEINAQREELEEQNIAILTKNELINGSIRYAKTIQTAILPFKERIDKHFENFILFRPKDIVSGDFYWYVKSKNYHFIAAVDCTGHGVPGAFMSMIGSSLLNQIVHNDNEFNTANILTKLNELVIFSLRQEHTDNNDGMDVCLCRIERQESSAKIQFTGAKRPLLYIQKNNIKIERLKGNRKSIGGTQKKRNVIDFTIQEIELENDSTIYLSSDGYIDQNNSSRKKFGTSKLISTLESLSQEDLKRQHEILNSKIETWLEGTEQRDDITLLGVKL